MAPGGTQQAKYDTAASSDLQGAINSAFGDFNSFKAQLTAAAGSVFGSGWAWLIVADDGLAITTSPNQNNPLQTALASGTNTTAGIPVMGIDVWEHAYYLKHFQNRSGWIANFFLVLNWAQISENYNYAAAGGVPDTSETPMLTSYPSKCGLCIAIAFVGFPSLGHPCTYCHALETSQQPKHIACSGPILSLSVLPVLPSVQLC